jgi:hypothetical protein
MPEIMGLLHAKPDAGAVAEKLTEADSHGTSIAFLSLQVKVIRQFPETMTAYRPSN